MRMSEALDAKAELRRGAKSKKTLRSVEIERADNGGHTVIHRYASDGPAYHEPDRYVFGKSEGKKLAAHLSKHMGIMMDADGDQD